MRMHAMLMKRQMEMVFQFSFDVIGIQNSVTANTIRAFFTEAGHVGEGAHDHSKIAVKRTHAANAFGQIVIQFKLITLFNDLRGR